MAYITIVIGINIGTYELRGKLKNRICFIFPFILYIFNKRYFYLLINKKTIIHNIICL